jgi:hypothetical protein
MKIGELSKRTKTLTKLSVGVEGTDGVEGKTFH